MWISRHHACLWEWHVLYVRVWFLRTCVHCLYDFMYCMTSCSALYRMTSTCACVYDSYIHKCTYIHCIRSSASIGHRKTYDVVKMSIHATCGMDDHTYHIVDLPPTKDGHLLNLLATPVTLCKGWLSGSNIHTLCCVHTASMPFASWARHWQIIVNNYPLSHATMS